MKESRAALIEKYEQDWNNWLQTPQGKESCMWTLANRLLSSQASDTEYMANTGGFASYDGSYARVRPHSKPVVVKKGAREAFGEL